MNNVQLRGRLTTDPEVRTFLRGDEQGCVASFVLAVPDRTSRKDEQGNYETSFIRCSLFGKGAEVMESFGCKGTEIIVSQGKIVTGSYDKDGTKVYTTEVSVQTFEFVSGTKSKEEHSKNDKKDSKK